MTMEKEFDAVIIGAGLTGLTAAYYLNKRGKSFLVLDKSDRVGGVISTRQVNGFLYEEGPNTGIIGTPEIAELFEAIKDDCKIIEANDQVNARYILKDGNWEILPSGLIGGIKTPLFTLKDKIRLLKEPFRKRGTDTNESLAEIVKRRMGLSFLEYAVDPFILGVYAGDPAYLITKYALPKLYKLEQDYGSFIGGAVKKKFQKKDERNKKVTRKIFSAEKGLSSITDTLYALAGKGNFILGSRNITIQCNKGIYEIKVRVPGKDEFVIRASSVISTVPAFELKEIMHEIDTNLLKDAGNVYYAPVLEVALGFNKWGGMPLEAFGGLIPFKENRDILGIMFMSSLFKGRAPKEGALLSIFIGGARRLELTKLNKEEVAFLLEKDLVPLMKLKEFKPELFEIFTHKQAIPQYGSESKIRIIAVEKIRKKYPGLLLGGNLCDGIGMADRVKQGRQLADFVR